MLRQPQAEGGAAPCDGKHPNFSRMTTSEIMKRPIFMHLLAVRTRYSIVQKVFMLAFALTLFPDVLWEYPLPRPHK